MAITPAAVKDRFPEFSAVEDSAIQLQIDVATIMLDDISYPKYINMLMLYLTAHILQLSIETSQLSFSSMGAVTSATEGDLSVSYAATAASSTLFWENINSTKYGQQYALIIESMRYSNYPIAVL